MTPIKSSTNKESCSPISSNCVIWQGPNLPCINLCTGDSVSDVIYRVADELCKIKDNFDLTDVDLECILTVCQATPEPAKTIGNILNLIINKVCCLSDIVAAIDPSAPEEIEVQLASCFKPYLNPSGVPLNSLPHSQYTYLIGVKLCELVSQVAINTLDITTLKGKVKALEDAPAPTIPQVTTNCITAPNVTPGVPADVDKVLDALEAEFCNLTAALGPTAEIIKVKSRECQPNLTNAVALASPTSTMGSYYAGAGGWVNTTTNLAQSLQNLWITVCDLRSAVRLIQTTCCQVSCDDIIVDFDVVRTTNTLGNPVIQFFFYPKTVIPDDWYDCNQSANPVPGVTNPYTFKGNTVTITDTAGHKYQISVPLRKQDFTEGILPDFITSGGLPYEVVLTASPLDLSLDWTITGDICVTNGTTSCVKCVSVDAPYTPLDCCTITATDTVTIVYKTCITPVPEI